MSTLLLKHYAEHKAGPVTVAFWCEWEKHDGKRYCVGRRDSRYPDHERVYHYRLQASARRRYRREVSELST